MVNARANSIVSVKVQEFPYNGLRIVEVGICKRTLTMSVIYFIQKFYKRLIKKKLGRLLWY